MTKIVVLHQFFQFWNVFLFYQLNSRLVFIELLHLLRRTILICSKIKSWFYQGGRHKKTSSWVAHYMMELPEIYCTMGNLVNKPVKSLVNILLKNFDLILILPFVNWGDQPNFTGIAISCSLNFHSLLLIFLFLCFYILPAPHILSMLIQG